MAAKNTDTVKNNNLGNSKIVLLAGILLFLVVTALVAGRYPISIHDVWKTLMGRLLGIEISVPSTVQTVIFNLRVPRILAAILIGFALSVSGAAYQGIFRNPLVSPDILGVSAGAGFGATVAILNSWGSMGIIVSAFICGLLAVWLTYFIGNKIKDTGEITLILVLGGILVGTVFSSLISLLKTVADPYEKLPAITYWLMGSLNSIKMPEVYLVLPFILLSIIPLWLFRWQLNLLAFGDEEAKSLGVNTDNLRFIVIVCATLLTASAVSISGMIGWVGLVIPHFARAITGPNYQTLIPVSILIGGSFLLAVDTIARSLLSMEIPLGILTSLIGAPFFVYLLSRSRRGWR